MSRTTVLGHLGTVLGRTHHPLIGGVSYDRPKGNGNDARNVTRWQRVDDRTPSQVYDNAEKQEATREDRR